MPDSLRQRVMARVLFDEYHSEAWTIRPLVAETMRPDHPGAASYVRAAAELDARDFATEINSERPLLADTLRDVGVLVIAHPSSSRWEPTVNDNGARLSAEEIEAIEAFVRGGGGLVVLGEAEEEKFGGNLNELLERFGTHLDTETVFDYTHYRDTPVNVLAEPAPSSDAAALLHLVDEVSFNRAGALSADRADAVVLRSSGAARPAYAGLLAAVGHGDGRVVVAADSDLFGDDQLSGAHLQLWLNIVYWVAAKAFSAEPRRLVSKAASDPAWARLKAETNALRQLQEPDGAVDLELHQTGEVHSRVEAMIDAVERLAAHFPHQDAYLRQLPVDLRTWVDAGCGKPDFTASLDAFRPDQQRRDGIEHLVVFPMYTPNGSPDTRFEALIVQTPWPDFIAGLERGGYDNDKYVPVQLVDFTDGYDSECAVLFPETVSLAGRASNNFGGIFCDREAERFRRSTARGVDALRIDLPPDAQALISSPELSRDVYIMWDLIHDRWHSHGDLPFDPFMIRQRLPYWMYSVEELRVDLASYGSAVELAQQGFPFARYMKYAILFDRILRFPITGSRVRNYDGLGGQLLFAYLHQNGVIRWSSNRLWIDWRRLDGAVADLRGRLDALYREGIDLSRVSYWAATHDLIAEFVRPNIASQWTRENRVISDEAEPRAWVDRVLDDEFPLSMFYETLKKKLGELEAEGRS